MKVLLQLQLLVPAKPASSTTKTKMTTLSLHRRRMATLPWMMTKTSKVVSCQLMVKSHSFGAEGRLAFGV
jgi:hypothetical protein